MNITVKAEELKPGDRLEGRVIYTVEVGGFVYITGKSRGTFWNQYYDRDADLLIDRAIERIEQ